MMPVEKVTISGFMILKNAVSQGYPFLEAILAALPVCDEFLVSDGYSSDRTWEALHLLQRADPDKIKLFRDEWKGPVQSGEIIAVMTNVLKGRCTGSYCLYIQGNEILHEASLEELRRLPILYPHVEMFRLSFYNLMGGKLIWLVDFRRRLFKRKDHIQARGDGFDVGYDPKRLLLQPRKLIEYVLHATGERTYYLPQPFYRYRALFPTNYLKKLESRDDLYRGDRLAFFWRKESQYARAVLDEVTSQGQPPEVFWQKMRVYFDDVLWKDLPPEMYPSPACPRYCIKESAEGPKIMRHLLHQWEYDLQSSLDLLESAIGDRTSGSTVGPGVEK